MNEKIKIMENGKLVEYDVYKICHSDKFNKNYIIYTDGKEYRAASYIIKDKEVVLNAINNDAEWDFIDEELNNNE